MPRRLKIQRVQVTVDVMPIVGGRERAVPFLNVTALTEGGRAHSVRRAFEEDDTEAVFDNLMATAVAELKKHMRSARTE